MSEPLDKQLDVADVYAAALFDLARDAGQIDRVRSELEELVRLLELEPVFALFTTSRALSDERRATGLERMLRGKLSDLTLNALLVMNRHGRSGLLRALLRSFSVRQVEAAGEVEGTATTAVALTAPQQADVAQVAAKLTGRKPLLQYVVDADVLGGLVLQVGGWRYDNSVRRKLTELYAGLLQRGERGLAAGMTT